MGGCRRISGTAEGGILYDCFVICRGSVVDFVLLKRRNLKIRLLYFCSYIQRQQNGVWEPYLNEKDQDGRFHFAIAILGGILLCAGGVY